MKGIDVVAPHILKLEEGRRPKKRKLGKSR